MAKISEDFLNSALAVGGIEFDDSERVPFFVVDSDSVFSDGETEINVIDNFYTITLNDVTYVKMDSTHKNTDGTFSGAEPTYRGLPNATAYTVERQLMWAEQFSTAISSNKMQEIRRGVYMWNTLDGAKTIASELVNAKFDELGTQGFTSDCLGEIKQFDSDAKSVSMIMGQAVTCNNNLIMKLVNSNYVPIDVKWRETGQLVCYTFTDEQMLKLSADLQAAIQALEHARGEVLNTIGSCVTVQQVKAVVEAL